MKKLTLLLFVTLSLISCEKEDHETFELNYSDYLNQRTPCLIGTLNSQKINWINGENLTNIAYGYEYFQTDPVRILNFGISANGGLNYFTFFTPKIDTSNQNEVHSILNLGEKQIGEFRNNFYMSFNFNNKYYKTSSTYNQKIEILKTEEFVGLDNTPHVLVWVKIDNVIFENSNQKKEKLRLKNAILIAELYGHVY